MGKMLEEIFGYFFQVSIPLKWYKTCLDAELLNIAKYVKFNWNSHLLLDISLPIFLSKITFVAINHSVGAVFNTVFPVMVKVI